MPFDAKIIGRRIDQSARTIAALAQQADAIAGIGRVIAEAFKGGHKLLVAGNGGSAAEAMHLAEELTGKYRRADRKPLPALCLNSDPTALTCIANDWDFASVFSRLVEAFAVPGDVLLLFSTSGNSENLLRAAASARAADAKTIGLLGKGGGKLLPLCDFALVVDADDTGHVQEAHQVILHLILEQVEAVFESH